MAIKFSVVQSILYCHNSFFPKLRWLRQIIIFDAITQMPTAFLLIFMHTTDSLLFIQILSLNVYCVSGILDS